MAERPPSAPAHPEPPQTREGWFVLHDCYSVDWPRWRSCSAGFDLIEEFQHWLEGQQAVEKGGTAFYSVVGQKADLMLLHYRESVAALDEVELLFRRLRLHDFLKPAYSFLSVIELGTYEASGLARRELAQKGIQPGAPGFEQALAVAVEGQLKAMEARLFRRIPEQSHICFYPMSKRRGEGYNWYALDTEARRDLMRGHGRVGQQYAGKVVQVIGGAIGLDDWEWGVSLHADDPLVFKKLVTEMRYDPASSRYAEFGPFFVGLRHQPADLKELLA